MKIWFSLFVLIVGIIYYVAWSATFNAWTDIGTYSVTMVPGRVWYSRQPYITSTK